MTTRILLVNAHGTDLAAGGAETHVCRLALLLTERGYDVTILAAFPQAGPAVARTLTLHRSDAGKNHLRRIATHVGDIASIPSSTLQRAVAHIAPDVVHTHNLSGISTGVWEVCHRQGVPVVHTLHDYGLLCPWVTLMRPNGERCHPHPLLCGARARRLARWDGAVADVAGVSEHVLNRHAGLFARARRHVIRNPFAPLAHVDQIPPPRPTLSCIGYLGRLDIIKGVQHLVAIGPELAAMGISLRIAGDGRLRPEVERLAASISSVHYAGVVTGDDRLAFFGACDLGIIPSVWEEPGGPTYAMVEWLSAARPVISSTSGGLREALAHTTGVIPVHPTPAHLLEAITRLRDEPTWRRALAAVAPPDENPAEQERAWVATHEAIYRAARDHGGLQ
jgi:glycosyltransferase involved in cell wall biosynthesis